ncbi:c-type cytochrome [Solimonas terrae]|uniref:Cytochrome c n=1 Tax=Solimonas terrae TaxID=1396819 RepID=A0A6M2BWN3_9GAMM|nr:cytochrome c [Solimonas terrae]NGY06543.1 cytochrome c [Solimonas terrae]
MKLKRLPVSLALAAVFVLPACEQKPPISPEVKQAMETRHEGFEKIGDSMKTIADTLKAGGSLNPELASAANTIDDLAPQLKDWFPAGSGHETKRKTGAKAEIWLKPDEFAQKREALVTEAGKLAALANANDAAGFAAQVPELGKACKGCHDEFRDKDHH